MRGQMLQLQQEMEAAFALVQRVQNQEAVNTGLLQYTPANVQHTANTYATQHTPSSSNVSSQLDNMIEILNTNFPCIDEDLKIYFPYQNIS